VSSGLCPRCDAPYGASQEYCLECGHRLPPPGGALARLAARWTQRFPRLPGDWAIPSLLALVVAVAGATAAIALSSDGATEPAISTATGGSLTATDSVETIVPPEPTTPPATTGAPAPAATTAPQPPPPRPQILDWPKGKDGWTIVLVSLPKSGGRARAVAAARQALAAGLRGVGILDSSRFPSLHPGYYVVFAGIYETSVEATSALQRARAAFSAAYTRQITS
jgi:hypothetical protein